MTKRRMSPIHNLWHRRVEGQIRHVIRCHPEWFRFDEKFTREVLINSLAKRIVGEIVAAYGVAPTDARVLSRCAGAASGEDDTTLSSPES